MNLDFNFLLNYGVLGLWTISLMYEKYNVTQRMVQILEKIEKKLNISVDTSEEPDL